MIRIEQGDNEIYFNGVKVLKWGGTIYGIYLDRFASPEEVAALNRVSEILRMGFTIEKMRDRGWYAQHPDGDRDRLGGVVIGNRLHKYEAAHIGKSFVWTSPSMTTIFEGELP